MLSFDGPINNEKPGGASEPGNPETKRRGVGAPAGNHNAAGPHHSHHAGHHGHHAGHHGHHRGGHRAGGKH